MDVLELTRALVAIDSQNPGAFEPEISGFVREWALERGFDVRVLEPIAGRPNVVVTLDRGGAGHVGLSGHLDTKPIGDALSAWHTPPLELTVVGDEAFGLGATDMKGAVAAMMLALERLAGDDTLSGRVSLLLTADEEQGSDAGAKALAAQGLLPELDGILIGEPSGIERPWEAVHLVSRGICCFEVEITTRQGHSGLSPRLGRNAIQVAGDVLRAFESFTPSVDSPGEVACAPTVNPGIFVSGGVSYGTWPGHASVGIEVRLVPGMTQATLHREVDEVVRAAVGASGEYAVRYRQNAQGWMGAVELSPRSALARAAQDAAQSVLGFDVPFAAFPGGTDATYLMGDAGVPTIASLGPGWISVAHGANEKVGVDSLFQSVDLYADFARRFLHEQSRTSSEEIS